jgi:hypothetical protein
MSLKGGSVHSTGPEAGPLAEFTALRAEVERRATGQWNVLALQIAIAGAVFGFALSAPRREILLLVVPIASYMTCGRYIIHARGLRLISIYIRESLSDRVPGGLLWEQWRQGNVTRFPIGHFGVAHFTGVVFPGISLLAIVAFIVTALSNGLHREQSWYVVAAALTVLGTDIVLTALIVQALWINRFLAESSATPTPANDTDHPPTASPDVPGKPLAHSRQHRTPHSNPATPSTDG